MPSVSDTYQASVRSLSGLVGGSIADNQKAYLGGSGSIADRVKATGRNKQKLPLFELAAPGPSLIGADLFANATLLTLGGAGSVTSATLTDNTGFGIEAGEPDPTGFLSSASAWWKFVAPATETLVISAASTQSLGNGTDTEMAVWTGTAVNALTGRGADSDSGGNFTSLINLSAIAGTTYYVQIRAYQGRAMRYGLTITRP